MLSEKAILVSTPAVVAMGALATNLPVIKATAYDSQADVSKSQEVEVGNSPKMGLEQYQSFEELATLEKAAVTKNVVEIKKYSKSHFY